MSKSLEINNLLQEVLVDIFSYLSVDDIKSCRLVCRKWRFCCEHPTITQNEKFVLRRVYSMKGINNFLINLPRSRVNVEFVNIRLDKLDLKKFGSKIKKLQITNCLIDDEKTFKNLLVFTPNMKHLDLRLDETYDFSSLRETPVKVMVALERDNFQNRNLEIFEYHASSYVQLFSIPLLEAIFPRLRCIRLMEMDIMQTFIENCVDELYNCCIDFDKVDCLENFASIPKLRILHLTAKLSLKNRPSIELCERFFMRQTELEILVVRFEGKKISSVNVDDSVNDGAKTVLFRILKSCEKLTDLTFGLHDNNLSSSACFNEDDALEFRSLMRKSRIRVLGFSESCFRSMFLPFSLEDGSQNSSLSVIGEIYSYLLETPRLIVEMRSSLDSCTEIAKVFGSHPRLRRLEVSVKCSSVLSNLPLDGVIPPSLSQQHKVFNYLKINLSEKISSEALIALINYLSEWHFPNLATFILQCDIIDKKQEYPEFISLLMKWLKNMTNLEEVGMNFGSSNIADCIQMCKRLPKLQRFEWSSTEKPDPRVITSLFEECPRLKHIILHSHSNQISFQYYYCRNEKKLYRCKLANWEGSTRYKSILLNNPNYELSNQVAQLRVSDLLHSVLGKIFHYLRDL